MFFCSSLCYLKNEEKLLYIYGREHLNTMYELRIMNNSQQHLKESILNSSLQRVFGFKYNGSLWENENENESGKMQFWNDDKWMTQL